MVVIGLPATAATGIEQDRVGTPSIWTVQAPHCAMPQPNLVPVRPMVSRSTHRSGVDSSTSTLWDWPLMDSEIILNPPIPSLIDEAKNIGRGPGRGSLEGTRPRAGHHSLSHSGMGNRKRATGPVRTGRIAVTFVDQYLSLAMRAGREACAGGRVLRFGRKIGLDAARRPGETRAAACCSLML